MATHTEFLTKVPVARIRPTDGMAVTADVWERAHDYHHHRARLHALAAHGTGIVAGLEVRPSDPADGSVYVMPGYAIDPLGREIIVQQPVSFDLGDATGSLQLVLSYGEGEPQPDSASGRVEEGAPYLVREAFMIEVVGVVGIDRQSQGVHLARIQRTAKNQPIVGAGDAQQPGPNAIDTRDSVRIGAITVPQVRVVVVAAGRNAPLDSGDGFAALARVCNAQPGGIRVSVDVRASLDEALQAYSMIYVLGHGDFGLGSEEMTAIYNALQSGVTVVLDRSGRVAGSAAAETTFDEMLKAFGVELAAAKPDHPLFTQPNLFAQLPHGYDASQVVVMRVGDGRVIQVNADYDAIWRGLSAQPPATREQIRAAQEWGANLISYVAGRKVG